MKPPDLFAAIRDILCFKHTKGDDDPDRVFHRVFEKAVRMTLGDQSIRVPSLNRKNTAIALEERPIDALAALTNRAPRDMALNPYPDGSVKRFKRGVRKGAGIPVVVVNYNGRDYLIDGNRRVNYWLEKGGASTMQVFVVTVL